MSTALIMGLDVMATLFGVYTFGAFFTVTITFEGRGVELRKGRLPIGQVSCRTPSDWLYGVV
jgi:hypothetical protein